MVCAGEASGDMHCAAALRVLRNQQLHHQPMSSFEFFGMGGKQMAECDVELIVDIDTQSVMGVVEVLYQYPKLRRQLGLLRQLLTERKPDLLLLVDNPTFNMKLAATAKSLNIPVLYFIAPKVWASRPGRIGKLRQLVDRMAVILPFEEKIFSDAGIPVTYTGNPLLDNQALIAASASKIKRKPAVIDATSPFKIALLPGSRKSEIDYILPPMLEAAEQLQQQYPHTSFLLPVAGSVDTDSIAKPVAESTANIELIQAGNFAAIANCDAAIAASGTVTLELALLRLPMLVIYRLNKFTYSILSKIVLIDNVSLVNIIAEQPVVCELLQDDITAERVTAELEKLLFVASHRANQIAKLAEVHEKLGQPGAAQKLVELIIEMSCERDTQIDSARKVIAS